MKARRTLEEPWGDVINQSNSQEVWLCKIHMMLFSPECTCKQIDSGPIWIMGTPLFYSYKVQYDREPEPRPQTREHPWCQWQILGTPAWKTGNEASNHQLRERLWNLPWRHSSVTWQPKIWRHRMCSCRVVFLFANEAKLLQGWRKTCLQRCQQHHLIAGKVTWQWKMD